MTSVVDDDEMVAPTLLLLPKDFCVSLGFTCWLFCVVCKCAIDVYFCPIVALLLVLPVVSAPYVAV